MTLGAAAAAATLVGGFMVSSHSTDNAAAMPVGDIPGWEQTGTQDFSTPADMGEIAKVYGQDMRGYSGFSDTSGHGIYTPDSVLSVADGKLDYYLHYDGDSPRVASVIPFGYSGQKYGRYSIRFRSDSLPGYKVAFMLWPSSDKWSEGEIDWPEGGLGGTMYGASAITGSSDRAAMEFDPPITTYSPTDSSEWHVATTEWTPGKVKWFWDGELISQTALASGVPWTPLRWTLQAETGVGPGSIVPEASTAGHLEVDWVVQYAYAP
ncbi:glycoside hydrolase family 16 protein [Pseudarthrobacter sp. N5]|uniref:glycoside hydrolase family 16 protein n=1 Tax=Pseudarthrobacter sp. N5 TaxID=3418416 RepID=UPI003CF63BE4